MDAAFKAGTAVTSITGAHTDSHLVHELPLLRKQHNKVTAVFNVTIATNQEKLNLVSTIVHMY